MQNEVDPSTVAFRSTILNWTTLTLLLSNLSILYFYISHDLSFNTLLWTYWTQSVIIGIFNFFRIIRLKNFTTGNFRINNEPIKPTPTVKLIIAFFFAFHYGLFHLTYLFFLIFDSVFEPLTSNGVSSISWSYVLGGLALFLASHAFSFFYNNDSKKPQNIGKVMFFPYARIIPMHLIIILGSILISNVATMAFFIILKTIADVVMHVIEHSMHTKLPGST